MAKARELLDRFDRFQQRHPPLAITFAVLRKFSDDGAGNRAALIAYYGFFSIFPLLLLLTTILGFVLAGDPSAQEAVRNSVLKQIPVVGGSLRAGSLHGSGLGLAVGLVGALLSGMGVTMATQNAFNTVWAVSHKDRPNFLDARWRSLRLLVVIGLLQLIATAAAGLVAGGLGGVLLTLAGIIVALLLDFVMFFAVFRLMTDSVVPTRQLWPGIAIASVAWDLLQALGGIYIGHVVKADGHTYGTFAVVIGLLVWLYLGARVVVYAAEINVVLTRRLWPRSLFGDPELVADRRALESLAKIEERHKDETVDVTFDSTDSGVTRRESSGDAPAPAAD